VCSSDLHGIHQRAISIIQIFIDRRSDLLLIAHLHSTTYLSAINYDDELYRPQGAAP